MGAARGRGRAVGAYASMLALTLSNPPTILSFAAVFGGLGPRVSPGWPSAVALVLGVALGSALWWVLLSAVVSVARERFTATMLRGIGLLSGLALAGFGILITGSALRG